MLQELIREQQALIIDEGADSRSRLKQAVSASLPSMNVRLSVSLRDGVQSMRELRPEIVFLASSLTRSHGAGFLSKLAEAECPESKLVLVLQGDLRQTAVIIEQFASGIDGFLLEPYSPNDISSVVDTIQDVEMPERSERRSTALRFILQRSAALIDQIALQKLLGHGCGEMMRNLRQHGEALARLAPEDEDYSNLICSIFQARNVSPQHAALRQSVDDRKRMQLEEEQKKKAGLPFPQKVAAGPRIVRRRG